MRRSNVTNGYRVRVLPFGRTAASLMIAAALMSGCKSKQEEAIDLAKKQAATTGQAQQVVTIDKEGNTTTAIVQPPVPGQATQQITTTTTSSSAAAVPANTPAIAGRPVVGPAATPGYPGGQPAAGYAVGPGAAQAYAPTAAGSGPVVRPVDVNVPAGSTLTVRINQHVSVKTTPAGSRFDGEVAEPWSDANGRVVLPRGTAVGGIVDASHRRGHFKGASILELRLTSLTLNGTRYPLDTHDVVRSKKGKGKRSAAFIGGGTGLGMLIGGLAGGGVGLAAGGAAGAGAGTAVAGLTGNRDLDIPAESLLRFQLADDLTLRP